MKKLLSLCLLTVLTVTLLIPAAAFAAGNSQTHTVTVSGHAEVSVTPDLAIATFGAQTASADVETAKRENDLIMQKIYDAMLVAGIDRSKVKTAMFSVQPVYRSENNNGNETITGYRIQNTISITIEDIKNVSRVIDAAFNAGANQFQGVQFGVKKEQTLRDELLKQALEDGRRKAELTAEALGERLGRPVSVSESGHVSPIMMDSVRFKSMQAGTPIAAGSITASADVQMVFELQ